MSSKSPCREPGGTRRGRKRQTTRSCWPPTPYTRSTTLSAAGSTPLEPGVITIGQIHGGTVNNVIPDSVYLNGTIRSFTPDARRLLQEELRRACGVVEALGGSFELTIKEGYPPTVLDPEATRTAMEAAAEFLGEENVPEASMVMAAEDFAYMARAAPGSFLRLGTHNPEWPQRYFVHTSTFRIDEDALPVGAAALAAAAVKWMREQDAREEK